MFIEKQQYDRMIQKQKLIGTQQVVIIPEEIDISSLHENKEKANLWRPTGLNDYIGQEKAKARILNYLEGTKKFNEPFPHTFLSAPAGHGKTLLANIIANLLNKKFVSCVGGELKSLQQFIDKVAECDGGILFIDEANRISKQVGFFMLPIIEEFKLHDKNLKPFTVIFATTHLGDISKDLDALIQRCDLRLELEHYNPAQLVTILKQFKAKQYGNEDIDEAIYTEISRNARLTPRVARSLLREYIFVRDWKQVKDNNRIIKDGITETDIKTLRYLAQFAGVGKNTLANYLRIKPQTFEYEVEPFLIYKEFIIVSNRRKITDKGKEFLNEISK